MLLSTLSAKRGAPAPANDLGSIRSKLARALIGSTVDLLADARTIMHGVVTGVIGQADHPLIVVDGAGYDLNQILTVMPTSLN